MEAAPGQPDSVERLRVGARKANAAIERRLGLVPAVEEDRAPTLITQYGPIVLREPQARPMSYAGEIFYDICLVDDKAERNLGLARALDSSRATVVALLRRRWHYVQHLIAISEQGLLDPVSASWLLHRLGILEQRKQQQRWVERALRALEAQ